MSLIIDDNMHWLPENLLTNKTMRDAFINSVPRAYGEYAHVVNIPGTKI